MTEVAAQQNSQQPSGKYRCPHPSHTCPSGSRGGEDRHTRVRPGDVPTSASTSLCVAVPWPRGNNKAPRRPARGSPCSPGALTPHRRLDEPGRLGRGCMCTYRAPVTILCSLITRPWEGGSAGSHLSRKEAWLPTDQWSGFLSPKACKWWQDMRGPRRQTSPLCEAGLCSRQGRERQTRPAPVTSGRETVNHSSHFGSALVVQWWRIHLQMQGTQVQSLVWEDPPGLGATKPMCDHYWGHAWKQKPLQWEAHALKMKLTPPPPTLARRNYWDKPVQQWRPSTAPSPQKKTKNQKDQPTRKTAHVVHKALFHLEVYTCLSAEPLRTTQAALPALTIRILSSSQSLSEKPPCLKVPGVVRYLRVKEAPPPSGQPPTLDYLCVGGSVNEFTAECLYKLIT